MAFYVQTAEWAWSSILKMIKTHRNFRMFQKQAKKFKQTSLQGRSPSEIAFSLLYPKAEHAFRLTKKRELSNISFLALLFLLSGVGYPQPVMGQSAYPSHAGLVARPEDRLLLCATAEGF